MNEHRYRIGVQVKKKMLYVSTKKIDIAHGNVVLVRNTAKAKTFSKEEALMMLDYICYARNWLFPEEYRQFIEYRKTIKLVKAEENI